MPTDLEGNFYGYLHETGHASGDWNRKVLRYYVPFFKQGTAVLDVGCGQGEFLELLVANGIAAQGVDSDTRMVSLCHEKGLSVVEADLFAYLVEQQESFDGIFSSNVVEHLSAEDVLRFIRLAYAALRPGGIVLLATPNPASLIVHLHEFWRDATHVRLYNAALLEFMLFTAGFREIASGGNPHTVWTPPAEFVSLPELWRKSRIEPLAMASSRWQAVQNPRVDTNVSWLRRVRRRLARFLVQTVMFEEFKTLVESLTQLDTEREQFHQITEQSIDALYASQCAFLTIPREVFVVGYKTEAVSV